MATTNECAACGGRALEPHLRVAGDAGEEGLIPSTDRFGTALADIVRCGDCGHMQLERFPSSAELGEAYGDAESDDYIAEERGQRATARRVLAEIERFVGPGALLDFGCWVGYLLDEARDRGWRPIGVEPSRFASEYARTRLGVEVITAELDDAELPTASFRAVHMGDVIEHLPDPRAALLRAAELLESGGVLALALPDAGSRMARAMGSRWWSVIPTHVQYFTRASMRTLLARSGFEPLAISTAPKVFSVEYYLSRAGGYSDALGNALTRAGELAGINERLWAPDFRDRMLVIARPGGDGA